MKKIAKLASAVFLISVSSAFAEGEAPTDLDSLFRGKEFQLPHLDSSYRNNYSETSQVTNDRDKDGLYSLQFDSVADFDAAQARRARLQSQTGYSIQLVFDAPFYKLRGGFFKKKSEAEDKAREFSQYNVSAFVVKVK